MRNKYDLAINVMMVGGRRAGKTSLLAAMQNCFDAQCTNTSLFIGAADPNLLNIIDTKNDEIKNYFIHREKRKTFYPDENPSEGITKYPFYVGIKGKPNRICINFIDYQGEMIDGRIKEHWEQLVQNMDQCRILLIAIDTPHLMEEHGEYNEVKNTCSRITQMIKYSDFANPKKGDGMILFVPLKCERYYNDNRINDVTNEIKKVYKPLIDHIHQPISSQDNTSKITVAITPIMTMGLGTAQFSHFERDENYDIKTVKGLPSAYYMFMDNCKDTPEPKYCEQPLLYVLAFVLDQTSKVKATRRIKHFFFNFLETSLWNWPSAEDYQEQSNVIKSKIKQIGNGYEILDYGILKLPPSGYPGISYLLRQILDISFIPPT